MVGRGRTGNHQAKIARLGGVVQTQEVRLLPERGRSKGGPEGKGYFYSLRPASNNRGRPSPEPDAGTGVRDTETQRRRRPVPVWREGKSRGTFWVVSQEALPPRGARAPAGVPVPGRLSPASLVVLTPAAEGPPSPVQPEAGEGLVAQPPPMRFPLVPLLIAGPVGAPRRVNAAVGQESRVPV